jgi:hypothetical protein
MKKIITFLLCLVALGVKAQKFDGLALTPPMGWNSWNTFATDINEQLVKDIADDDWALCFVNQREQTKEINFDNTHNRKIDVNKHSYTIRDLFKKKDIGTTQENLKATIPPHDCLMVRLSVRE